MKIILTTILLFVYSVSFAHNDDSLVYKIGEKIEVYRNKNDNTFLIKKNNKIKFKKLKFVLKVWEYLQVLDQSNTIFYIDSNGNKREKTNIIMDVCGTVAHFTCAIKEQDDMYIITKNEYFTRNLMKHFSKQLIQLRKKGLVKYILPIVVQSLSIMAIALFLIMQNPFLMQL